MGCEALGCMSNYLPGGREGSWPIRGKGEIPLPQSEYTPPQREADRQPDRNTVYRDIRTEKYVRIRKKDYIFF